MKLERGYVQVYTGDGKGKTTAAFGLAMRAAGRGLRVAVVQFMKGGEDSGEVLAAKALPNISVKKFGSGKFADKKKPNPEDIKLAKDAIAFAKDAAKKGCDVLVLDEINCATDFGLLPVADVVAFLKSRPPTLEVVLTGRNAPKEIVATADLVTEMKDIKHYYRKKVQARIGIEY